MKSFSNYVASVFLVLLSIVVLTSFKAQGNPDPLADLFASPSSFLEVDDAFQFDFVQDANSVTLTWHIADDYYLYADKIQIVANGATIGEWQRPEGTEIEDEFFGVTQVYFFAATLVVPVGDIAADATLLVRYQGCAKAGLCYPPVTKTVPLLQIADNSAQESNSNNASQQYALLDLLNNQSLLWTLLIFFGLGVGLAATPCVFPMFPILSGIIAGQQQLTWRKGLWLAFIYVQGMALMYSLLGLIVASAGSQFQAYLQHPAILIAVSVLFVVLAGAMFGWYTLQLPASWTSRLTEVSNKQRNNAIGVFLMGALSGLIASPCTTAPLTGALLYVAQTGDLVIGFVTLYVLSLGMGLPLLLIGASGGSLLPKAGAWMNTVKHLFGFVLLLVPVILLERMITETQFDIVFAVWMFGVALYLHSFYQLLVNKIAKSVVWALQTSLLVFALWVGALSDQSQNSATSNVESPVNEHGFIVVKNQQELARELKIAQQNNQWLMFDLYADWCVACKEFEKYTFSDAAVIKEMSRFRLIQIDMTETTDEDIALMEQFSVFGLPTIMFFDKNGNEQTQQRVTGFLNAPQFLSHLQQLK